MLGTADKLKNARQIALTGDVTGSANFDGSGNISIPTSVKNSKTQTNTVSTKEDNIGIKMVIKRNMNIVHISIVITVPAGTESGASLVNLDNLLPAWAKCTDDTSEFLGSGNYFEGVQVSDGSNASKISSYCKCYMNYAADMSVKHRLGYSFVRGEKSSEQNFNFAFSYVI